LLENLLQKKQSHLQILVVQFHQNNDETSPVNIAIDGCNFCHIF
jgi:hypothetical protein